MKHNLTLKKALVGAAVARCGRTAGPPETRVTCIAATVILVFLFAGLVNAQGQEDPRDKLHRDFPNVQMIRPSSPAWFFNFESKRWERERTWLDLPAGPARIIRPRDLRLLKHGPKRLRNRRNSHHVHRRQRQL